MRLPQLQQAAEKVS